MTKLLSTAHVTVAAVHAVTAVQQGRADVCMLPQCLLIQLLLLLLLLLTMLLLLLLMMLLLLH
jgi:hypothetical protein